MSVFPCYRSLKIYFWFISFPNLWKVLYVPNIYVYIYFCNYFCFKVYFLIICAFDFYLMMNLNVCPEVFRLCSILKTFLHIFLLLLNIFLLYFHGMSSERTSKHLICQCHWCTLPNRSRWALHSLEWSGLCCGAVLLPNTVWQTLHVSDPHKLLSHGNLKFSIFALSFSHQTLCQLKMYSDWRCEVKVLR